MSRKNIFYLIATILSLISCSKAEIIDVEEDQVPIGLNMTPTGASNSIETDIENIRIIAFTNPGGTLKINQLFTNVTQPNLQFSFWTGIYDFWFIANEPETIGFVSISSIDNIKLTYTVGTPSVIPMVKSIKSRTITLNSSDLGTINMVRTMAKVELKIIIDPADFIGKPFPIVSSVQICGLPKYCFLSSQEYDSSEYINSENQNPVMFTENDKVVYQCTFYIPEFILADVSKYAWLKLEGKMGETGQDCSWGSVVKSGIGEASAVIPLSNRNDIRRNTLFDITGKIKGYGSHELTFTAEITDWKIVNIDDDLN